MDVQDAQNHLQVSTNLHSILVTNLYIFSKNSEYINQTLRFSGVHTGEKPYKCSYW